MELKKAAMKYALQNAVQFNGKANAGAVIGKILSEDASLKAKIREVAKEANAAVKQANSMKPKEQLAKLEKTAPELLERKKAEKRGLAELPNAKKGKVVTRIPPEPSKYAHIGHAISFMINYLYAKKYEGKCHVRFEDTNPKLAAKEYVDAILDDLEYLGIKAESVKSVSDDMEGMYRHAEKLIGIGAAYVCNCDSEKMREHRRKGAECECRQKTAAENAESWKRMLAKEYKEGEAVLRLKGDMKAKNTAMRDPVLFRVAYDRHYRHGNKYCAWPLYDFENAFEDGMQGITHILRSIEFGSMRVELQDRLKTLLGLPKQTVVQYGRFNVTDALTQGREIRDLIDRKEVAGWDDPRLVTIKALRRRGIQPQTFSELAIEVGLSTTQTNIDWSVIAAINRKYLDQTSRRYFFVENPMKVKVAGAPSQKIALKLHPSDEKAGRRFETGSEFLIAEKDYRGITKYSGELVRLMDCLNLTAEGERLKFDSTGVEKYREKGKKIIHWLPAYGNIKAEVMMPTAETVTGLAEIGASKVNEDEIVQFMRFGFCRLEKKEKGRLYFIYCHE